MTELCSAAVTSNANSKLCQVDLVAGDTSLSAPIRMELIMRIANDYDRGTGGSIERIRARDQAAEGSIRSRFGVL